jgi:hypothetical protein
MCWRCGAIRPQDGHGIDMAVLVDHDLFIYKLCDDTYVQALDVIVEDEQAILDLIGAGCVADFDRTVGWQELSAFPPFVSPFFRNV